MSKYKALIRYVATGMTTSIVLWFLTSLAGEYSQYGQGFSFQGFVLFLAAGGLFGLAFWKLEVSTGQGFKDALRGRPLPDKNDVRQ